MNIINHQHENVILLYLNQLSVAILLHMEETVINNLQRTQIKIVHVNVKKIAWLYNFNVLVCFSVIFAIIIN